MISENRCFRVTWQRKFFRLFVVCVTCVSLSCGSEACYASSEKRVDRAESDHFNSDDYTRMGKVEINKAEVNMDKFVSQAAPQGTTGRISIASVNNHVQEVGGSEFYEDNIGARVKNKEQK